MTEELMYLLTRYEADFHEKIPPLACDFTDEEICRLLRTAWNCNGKQNFNEISKTEFLQRQYKIKFGEELGYNYMTIHTEQDLLTALRECLATGKPYELPGDINKLIDQGTVF